MRSHRRWLALAAPAAVAALAALVFAAPAASSPPAAATAPHVNRATAWKVVKGSYHTVQRGLVKDCEYIDTNSQYIQGEGKNNPVLLETTGSCFNLYNKFKVKIVDILTGDTVTATGYQYQTDGHCLWENDTSGDLELGVACSSSDTSESFYAIPGTYAAYGGWLVSNEYGGYYVFMDSPGCTRGSRVVMTAVPNGCNEWNFPSSD